MALWVLFGAVRGAEGWEISGGDYVAGVLVAAALVGLMASSAQPRHWTDAGLLVIPGLATLASAGPGAHPDAAWWYLSLGVGFLGAAGTHRLAYDVRRTVSPALARRLHRRSALAGGPPSR